MPWSIWYVLGCILFRYPLGHLWERKLELRGSGPAKMAAQLGVHPWVLSGQYNGPVNCATQEGIPAEMLAQQSRIRSARPTCFWLPLLGSNKQAGVLGMVFSGSCAA